MAEKTTLAGGLVDRRVMHEFERNIMEIMLLTTHQITPDNMAKALAKATPREFAQFWFSFAQECKDEKTLDAFAAAMAPDFGGARKHPFKKLAALVQFHEMAGERGKSA